MTRRFWTAEEDAALRAGFESMSFAELCASLNRDPSAIGARCRTIGLRPASPPSRGLSVLSKAWYPAPARAPGDALRSRA